MLGATLPGWHCQLELPGPPLCWVWKQQVARRIAPGAGEQVGSHPAALAALQGGAEAGSWVHLLVVLELEAAASETVDPPLDSWWGRWWELGAGSYQGPGEKQKPGHLCCCGCHRQSFYRLPNPQQLRALPSRVLSPQNRGRGRQHKYFTLAKQTHSSGCSCTVRIIIFLGSNILQHFQSCLLILPMQSA